MERPDGDESEKKSNLLIVIGEPFNDQQKNKILGDLETGLKSWNNSLSACNIWDELQSAVSKFQSSDEGPNGERTLQYSSGHLTVDVLINPQLKTLLNKTKIFFTSGGDYYHIVYSGLTVKNTGSWILQDSLFHLSNLADVFRSAEVSNAIKQNTFRGHVYINSNVETEWTEIQLSKLSTLLTFTLNAEPVNGTNLSQDFVALMSKYIYVRSISSLLRASNVVGNIRFTRPTLYVFPGCQGDSSLFGVSGFNLLVDAGYGRKSAFWDFARHLDRIDSLLLTHLGPDNFFGLSSVVSRKLEEDLHPEIGCVFLNAISDLSKIVYSEDESSLLMNVTSESTKLVDKMKQVGMGARPFVGTFQNGSIQSSNLYHKVGHGSLDMYVLNPMQDSKSLKEFLMTWNKGGSPFVSKSGLPLCNASSVSVLLVWKPSLVTDTITRLLFPGSVSQEILFEGLDKIKNMSLFQHPHCTEKNLIISKTPSKKIPAKLSVSQKPVLKSLSSASAIINSPKSEISSPRSEHSLKEKKPGWPSRKEPSKENAHSEAKKIPEKTKDQTSKHNEQIVADNLKEKNAKQLSSDTENITVELHGVPLPPENMNVDFSLTPSTGTDLEHIIKNQNITDVEVPVSSEVMQESTMTRHDSLENVDISAIPEMTCDIKSKDEGTFDTKTLQKGLQDEANPFLGIETSQQTIDGKQEDKDLIGEWEQPQKLPPPVRLGLKQSPSANVQSRKVGQQGSQVVDRKTSQDSEDKLRMPSFHKKPDTKPTKDLRKTSHSSTTSRGNLKPIVPLYVDLTYIPNHGDPKYVDIEFFKRVRARYYVFSSINPDASVLTALLEAKQTWEDADLEVTIIPTYDAEVLRYWLAAHHDQLSQLKINVAPAANRCTIQLQDHETSCAAYRLEF